MKIKKVTNWQIIKFASDQSSVSPVGDMVDSDSSPEKILEYIIENAHPDLVIEIQYIIGKTHYAFRVGRFMNERIAIRQAADAKEIISLYIDSVSKLNGFIK